MGMTTEGDIYSLKFLFPSTKPGVSKLSPLGGSGHGVRNDVARRHKDKKAQLLSPSYDSFWL